MASLGQSSVLVIGKVWPEHSSTAAGVRTSQLVRILVNHGASVTFASAAKPNEFSAELESSGVPTFQLPFNDSSSVGKVLGASEPAVCIFDRFTIEEAFSFHIRNLRPQCLRVLDTQDLHFLRAGRQQKHRENAPLEDILKCRPHAEDPMLLRELSSIYRSDLSLICSREELHILNQHYGVPRNLLAMGSFFYPSATVSNSADSGSQDSATVPTSRECGSRDSATVPGTEPGASVEDAENGPEESDHMPRKHFVFIGTFKHAPNVDAVVWLAHDIWPRIRRQVPDAECHVYGSYVTGPVSALHRPQDGFFVKGHAPSLSILQTYRAGLAPLRFGAGIKGKILDSWRYGLPVVTTPIGAEGLQDAVTSSDESPPPPKAPQPFCVRERSENPDLLSERISSEGRFSGGLGSATTASAFAADAVQLYTNAALWRECAFEGSHHLQRWFDEERNSQELLAALEEALAHREERRRNNVTGAMLWMNSHRSTEYFSRWLELKESLKCME